VEPDLSDLSESQQRAAHLVLKVRANTFITGGAGTGKSHLIRRLMRLLADAGLKAVITASTGVASYNVGGNTLHRLGGFGLGDEPVESLVKKLKWKNLKLSLLRGLDVLLIDEISMITSAYLNKLDKVLRRVRNRPLDPLGGVQLVAIGDFLQCRAISKPGDEERFDDAEARVPLFESKLWCERLKMQCVVLRENFRQRDDDDFAALLDRVRLAQTSEADMETLRGRLLERHPKVNTGDLIKLCSYKKDAERLNREALALLDTKLYSYSAQVMEYDEKGVARPASEEERRKDQPVDVELSLKVGARVLLCHNLDVARGLYNGARGTVVDFRKSPQSGDTQLYPQVEFEGRGGSVLVEPHKWERKEGLRVVSSFTQIPLLLCYAVTIHKAQGLTLPSVQVTMDFFECGQGYVGLSRTRRLEDLYLTNIDMKRLLTHDAAVKFYTDNELI